MLTALHILFCLAIGALLASAFWFPLYEGARQRQRRAEQRVAFFDHDHDGKPGGSLPKTHPASPKYR